MVWSLGNGTQAEPKRTRYSRHGSTGKGRHGAPRTLTSLKSCDTSNLTILNGFLQTSGIVAHGDEVQFVCKPQFFLLRGINETSVICNNGTWETEYNSLMCSEPCDTSNLAISNGFLQTSGIVAHGDEVHFVCNNPQFFLPFGGINETSVICNNGTWETEYNSLMCSEADYGFCYGNLKKSYFHRRSESCFFMFKERIWANETSEFCNQQSGSGWRGRTGVLIDQAHFDEIQLKLIENTNIYFPNVWQGFWIGLKRINQNVTFMWYEGKENHLVSNFSQTSFPNFNFDLSVITDGSGIFPYTAYVTPYVYQYGANEMIQAKSPDQKLPGFTLCEFIFVGNISSNAPGSCRVSDIRYVNGTIDTKESVSSEIIQNGQDVRFLCNGAMSLANDVTKTSVSISCNSGSWNSAENLTCIEVYDYLFCQRNGGIYFHLTRACYMTSTRCKGYPFNYRFCEDSATPGWRGRLTVLNSQELHDFLFENANSLAYNDKGYMFWIGLRNLNIPWTFELSHCCS